MAKQRKKLVGKRVAFGNLKINRGILEIRYPKGYLYWDVCGRCILEINRKSNEKIDFSELRSNKCILRFVENPTAEASFGINQMTVSAAKLRNVNLFKENGPLILDTIKTYLKIQEFSRVGFRLFYVQKTDSHEEAEEFVNGLDICSVDVDRFKGFGDELSVPQPSTLVSNGEEKVRISISAAKRTDADKEGVEFDEYAPRYAILTDIDFYREDIKVEDFDLELFIHRSHKKIKDNIAKLLSK